MADKPKQVQTLADAQKYLRSLTPQYTASFGDGSREAYEKEQKRLQARVNDPALSEEERKNANGQLGALNQRYAPALQQWLTEDIQSAKTDEEAQAAAQKLDALRTSNFTDYNPALADLMTGQTGGKSPYLESGVGSSLAGPVVEGQVQGWNQGVYEDYANNIGDLIKRNAEITAKGNQAYFDNTTGRAIQGLKDTNAATTQKTRQALDQLAKSGQLSKDQINQVLDRLQGKADSADAESKFDTNRLTDQVGSFQNQRSGALQNYMRETGGLGKELGTKGYDAISSDRADVARTLDAYQQLNQNAKTGGANLQEVYDTYKGLSGPQMTAAETAILNQGQRKFARDDKAMRDAQVRDLISKGVFSGGAAIADSASRAQQLGDERVAAQEAARAGAVNRSMQAIQGMLQSAAAKRSSDTMAQSAAVSAADQMRGRSDQMQQFNAEQAGLTQRHREDFAQQEKLRLQKLAQDRFGTVDTTAKGNLDASMSLSDRIQDAINKGFTRADAVAGRKQAGIDSKYSMDRDQSGAEVDAARAESDRAEREANAVSSNAVNRATLNKQGSDDINESLKYLLSLKADALNLRNKSGASV